MAKRFFDIMLSFIGLAAFSPVFVFLAVWIVMDSKGGIFYRQVRVGQGGKDFLLLKFRTMYVDADKKGLITIGDRDPRVSKAGYFLRKYKLDELPQLLNVLFGDMSLVGPRPEVRKYVEMYNAEQQKVLQIKPGITDYASIEFSNENEILSKVSDPNRVYIEEIMPAKLELNLKYIKDYSLATYFKIIFLTIKKIIG
jgi:lipopolysaccharide/colanic/teichoic acid biosynthesis glycosyltransferase